MGRRVGHTISVGLNMTYADIPQSTDSRIVSTSHCYVVFDEATGEVIHIHYSVEIRNGAPVQEDARSTAASVWFKAPGQFSGAVFSPNSRHGIRGRGFELLGEPDGRRCHPRDTKRSCKPRLSKNVSSAYTAGGTLLRSLKHRRPLGLLLAITWASASRS